MSEFARFVSREQAMLDIAEWYRRRGYSMPSELRLRYARKRKQEWYLIWDQWGVRLGCYDSRAGISMRYPNYISHCFRERVGER